MLNPQDPPLPLSPQPTGVGQSTYRLTIIIVSYNVQAYLAACLTSIEASLQRTPDLSCETLVIDSASTDGSVEMIRAQFPWVILLAQAENVGFPRGNNIGLERAKGQYLLLLNPDTEVHDTALADMVAYMDTHPDVGLIGPHTVNTDGTSQSTRRRFPSLMTAMFESTWLQRFAPQRVLQRYYALDIPDTAIADVEWVQGSAMLTRHSVYQQVGGMDEQYAMFSEELDWCRRIHDAGWRIVYLGNVHITHHGGKSFDQVVASRHIYFQQSKIRYFNKFHGRLPASLLRLVLMGNYLTQMVIETGKALLGHKSSMRRERVRIYWQVLIALATLQLIATVRRRNTNADPSSQPQ